MSISLKKLNALILVGWYIALRHREAFKHAPQKARLGEAKER